MPTVRKRTATTLKNAGRALKNAGQKLKNAGQKLKNAGRKLKNSEHPADSVESSRISPPTLPDIALVAPTRTGRAVNNLDLATKNAEVRLLLAWKYRALLDPALPNDPPFHAHAWSALKVLKGERGASDSTVNNDDPGAAKAQQALETLLSRLLVLRGVVEDTTRPGDLARTDLRFSTPLKATFDLVNVGHEVIQGAKKHQHSFPALTDMAIIAAENALANAKQAVQGRRRADVTGTTHRVDVADDQQLALDVLLDEMDHLRAAARSTLADVRPKLAGFLIAPLEPGHGHASSDTTSPPPSTPSTTTN